MSDNQLSLFTDAWLQKGCRGCPSLYNPAEAPRFRLCDPPENGWELAPTQTPTKDDDDG